MYVDMLMNGNKMYKEKMCMDFLNARPQSGSADLLMRVRSGRFDGKSFENVQKALTANGFVAKNTFYTGGLSMKSKNLDGRVARKSPRQAGNQKW